LCMRGRAALALMIAAVVPATALLRTPMVETPAAAAAARGARSVSISPNVKRCAGLHEWTEAAAAQTSGLLIPRPLRSLDTLANVCFDDVQQCVERAASGINAQYGVLACARIPVEVPEEARALVEQREAETQKSLHEMLLDNLQEPEVAQLLMDDMKAVCAAMKGIAAGKCNGLEIKVNQSRNSA